MTVVDIFRDKEGNYEHIEYFGHADVESRAGADVVCSAISALVINTINSLEVLANADISIDTPEEVGWLICRFNTPPDEKAALLVDSMILGLQTVRRTYGDEYLVINSRRNES